MSGNLSRIDVFAQKKVDDETRTSFGGLLTVLIPVFTLGYIAMLASQTRKQPFEEFSSMESLLINTEETFKELRLNVTVRCRMAKCYLHHPLNPECQDSRGGICRCLEMNAGEEVSLPFHEFYDVVSSPSIVYRKKNAFAKVDDPDETGRGVSNWWNYGIALRNGEEDGGFMPLHYGNIMLNFMQYLWVTESRQEIRWSPMPLTTSGEVLKSGDASYNVCFSTSRNEVLAGENADHYVETRFFIPFTYMKFVKERKALLWVVLGSIGGFLSLVVNLFTVSAAIWLRFCYKKNKSTEA